MKYDFRLGDSVVQALVFGNERPGPTMLNVHDDEDTSVDAGKANLPKYGGRLIELVHSGERLITFTLSGKTYKFDPNRIFSDTGIAKTLEAQSTYSPEAHAEIKIFATEYFRLFALDQEPVIIALHNATEGVFCVESFLPTGYLGHDAAATHVSLQRNKFDFFYVTESRHFDHLKARDYNVVLQNNAQVSEDGSLSVYFARKGIPYINVEAEIRHLKAQVEMVAAAQEMWAELQ
jgi:hypothetical protein